MSDDSPLPWTERQWTDLRSVAVESARKARVASTFLPLVGPVPADQATVPSNWVEIPNKDAAGPDNRLEVRAGKSLHLVTIACNVYLRGSEIADPELDAAKTIVRRAGEVLGRLEDAIIFQGRPPEGEEDEIQIQPRIYSITGGRDLTGLLQAPDTLLDRENANYRTILANYNKALADYNNAVTAASAAAAEHEAAAAQKKAAAAQKKAAADAKQSAAAEQKTAAEQKADAAAKLMMRVSLKPYKQKKDPSPSPIVDTVVEAIQRLEERGQFGPFAVVLGNQLFSDATNPSVSLVLPTDRLAEFLGGQKVLRSSVLPPDHGVVVALGGQPIELVLANDIDVKFLQVTLEPRYVLRVFERFVLRIKELDGVCGVVGSNRLWDPSFVPRAARS